MAGDGKFRAQATKWDWSHRSIEKCTTNSRYTPIDWKFELPLGGNRVAGGVCTSEPPPGLTAYFIEQKEFFERRHYYQERGIDYPDNAERFIFLSASKSTWRGIRRGSRSWFICTIGKPRWQRCWRRTRNCAKGGRTRRRPA